MLWPGDSIVPVARRSVVADCRPLPSLGHAPQGEKCLGAPLRGASAIEWVLTHRPRHLRTLRSVVASTCAICRLLHSGCSFACNRIRARTAVLCPVLCALACCCKLFTSASLPPSRTTSFFPTGYLLSFIVVKLGTHLRPAVLSDFRVKLNDGGTVHFIDGSFITLTGPTKIVGMLDIEGGQDDKSTGTWVVHPV